MPENEKDEKGYYKVDVIANLFGVSVRRVQQLTQEGICPTVQTSQGRRYELAPTIQRYIKYLSAAIHIFINNINFIPREILLGNNHKQNRCIFRNSAKCKV